MQSTIFGRRVVLPVRVKDGVLFPVLGVALVGCEKSTDIVDIDTVGLEDISQLFDELVQTAHHRDVFIVHRRVSQSLAVLYHVG